jgi:putative flippase GtrA
LLNRWWTFRATDGSVTFQAPRFLIVSLCALVLNLIVLELLVGALDVHKVVAQAAAILTATPVNFVGNKLWSFRLGHARGEAPAEE